VIINNRQLNGLIGFSISRYQEKNIIGKVNLEGLIKSTYGGSMYSITFLTSNDRVIGTISFENNINGKKSYEEFVKIYKILQNAETYREALRYDAEHNIERNSIESKVKKLETASSVYKEAFNTIVSIQNKNGNLVINTQKKE
jgi:hypothetical protein